MHVVGMGPAATRFGVVASGDASGEEPDRNVPRRGRGHLEIKSHVLYYLRLAPSVICYLAHRHRQAQRFYSPRLCNLIHKWTFAIYLYIILLFKC